MAEHDTLRDALQQMVDAFSPYAWGSIDNKRDALNAATEALASPAVATQEERDAKDAARYRWLRQRHWDDSNMCVVVDPKIALRLGSYCPSGNLLDDRIDAAIQGNQP